MSLRTLADFRADLAKQAEAVGDTIAGGILRSFVDLIDDYTAEQGKEQSVDDRLAEAGRIRAAWKDTEASLPDLIAEAAERGGTLGLGLPVDSIARRLGVTETYVYRKLREHRDRQAATNIARAQK